MKGILCMKKGWESWDCLAGEEKAHQGSYQCMWYLKGGCIVTPSLTVWEELTLLPHGRHSKQENVFTHDWLLFKDLLVVYNFTTSLQLFVGSPYRNWKALVERKEPECLAKSSLSIESMLSWILLAIKINSDYSVGVVTLWIYMWATYQRTVFLNGITV